MKPVEHVAPREAYDDTDGNPLVALDDEVVPRLLGDVRARAVLELACRIGRDTIRLAGGRYPGIWPGVCCHGTTWWPVGAE